MLFAKETQSELRCCMFYLQRIARGVRYMQDYRYCYLVNIIILYIAIAKFTNCKIYLHSTAVKTDF